MPSRSRAKRTSDALANHRLQTSFSLLQGFASLLAFRDVADYRLDCGLATQRKRNSGDFDVDDFAVESHMFLYMQSIGLSLLLNTA